MTKTLAPVIRRASPVGRLLSSNIAEVLLIIGQVFFVIAAWSIHQTLGLTVCGLSVTMVAVLVALAKSR